MFILHVFTKQNILQGIPYGWEKAYTAGVKYFINYVAQTTSWTHPMTCSLAMRMPERKGGGAKGQTDSTATPNPNPSKIKT
eukprot:XP_014068520.1 PREDICTED: syntaxin-binding protein 4-like [Salmo salar]